MQQEGPTRLFYSLTHFNLPVIAFIFLRKTSARVFRDALVLVQASLKQLGSKYSLSHGGVSLCIGNSGLMPSSMNSMNSTLLISDLLGVHAVALVIASQLSARADLHLSELRGESA
jgi:hypothetical protein